MGKRQVCFSLPVEMIEEMERIRDETGVSVSNQVGLMLKGYIIKRKASEVQEKKKVEKTVTEDVTVAVKCDFCGSYFNKDDVEKGWFNKITIDTTYPSKFDGIRFEGEICDVCIALCFKGKMRQVEEWPLSSD
jgi:hypothetical protein